MVGLLLGIRFLAFYFSGSGDGHIQSLILTSILIGTGFQVILVAFLSDLQSVNRRLMEDIQYRLKRKEYRKAT
jgi:multisubunit Na+/H+ antiporter MnhC subunit